MRHNAADSRKKTAKGGLVFQKDIPVFFIDGKYAAPVVVAEKFEGHGGRTFLTIFNTVDRAEHVFLTEWDELHWVKAYVDSPKEGAIQFIFLRHIQFNGSGLESILNVFIIVLENLLENVHEVIM